MEAIHDHDLGFDVLPTALVHKKVNPFKLRNKIAKLKQYYDVILVDSSPTLNEEMLSTMIASDQLLVVTSPDLPTLNCTMHAVRVAKRKKTPISGLIVNKARKKKFELTAREIQETAGVPVIAALPDDTAVLEALSRTIPGVAFSPKREFAVEYKKLAASLVGEKYRERSVLKMVKNMIAPDVSPQSINRAVLTRESEKQKK
jgi:septum site-determining protein MinD